MSDEETKSDILSKMLIGAVIAGLVSMLGYVGVGYRDLSEIVSHVATVQDENAKHFDALVTLSESNSSRMDGFDSYIKAHGEYASGSVKLLNQKIDFMNNQYNNQCDNLKSRIDEKSADRFTGQQGRAMLGLIDERYATVSRRLKEIEDDIREHKKQNHNGAVH